MFFFTELTEFCFLPFLPSFSIPGFKDAYHLTGVVNHYGDIVSGHYAASVRNFQTHRWYNFSDQLVKEITPEQIEVCFNFEIVLITIAHFFYFFYFYRAKQHFCYFSNDIMAKAIQLKFE